jgi:hypothetical protein
VSIFPSSPTSVNTWAEVGESYQANSATTALTVQHAFAPFSTPPLSPITRPLTQEYTPAPRDLFAALLNVAKFKRQNLLAAELDHLSHSSPVASVGNRSPSLLITYSPPSVHYSPLAIADDLKSLPSTIIHATIATVPSPAPSPIPSHCTFRSPIDLDPLPAPSSRSTPTI